MKLLKLLIALVFVLFAGCAEKNETPSLNEMDVIIHKQTKSEKSDTDTSRSREEIKFKVCVL